MKQFASVSAVFLARRMIIHRWQLVTSLLLFIGNTPCTRAQATLYADFDVFSGGFGNNSSFVWNLGSRWTSDVSGGGTAAVWSNTTPPNNAVLGAGSGTLAYTAVLTSNVSVGEISVINGNWTVDLGSSALTLNPSANSTLAATLTGSGGSLIKSGSSTVTITTDSSYTGGTTINAGALRYNVVNTSVGPVTINSGGSLQIGVTTALPSTTVMTFAGGSLSLTGAFNQTFASALNMSASSTIDFGSSFGASAVTFGDSSAQNWNGTLLISNFNTAGGDTLRFGTSNSALTSSQLAAISFGGIGAQIDSSGFVTPVPEPQTYALLLGAGALAAYGYRRRRLATSSSA